MNLKSNFIYGKLKLNEIFFILDNANTSYVPIYIFTNGTYAFPLVGGLTTGLLGFGSILNFFPGE